MKPTTIIIVSGVVGAFAQWRKNAKFNVTRAQGGGPITTYTTAINPKFIIATIAVAFFISVITEANAEIGRDFAWLYLAGVLLVEGGPFLSSIAAVVTK
jgi:hypothetical protein